MLWHIFIHLVVLSLRGQAGRNQSPVMWPVWFWHTASCGKFLGVVCLCFPPPLDVPTFAARCLYVCNDATDPSSERWNCGRKIFPVILPKFRLPHKFRDLLHAANLRHGPTALRPLRRKACWGFFRPKNPTASARLEPANLGTKGQHATPRPPKPLYQSNNIKLVEKMWTKQNKHVFQRLTCLTTQWTCNASEQVFVCYNVIKKYHLNSKRSLALLPSVKKEILGISWFLIRSGS